MTVALATGLVACMESPEVADLKGRVEEVQAQQRDILAKLSELGKGQKAILAKAAAPAPAAKAAPPANDPNKVHNIPVGDSYWKGAEDAAVVLAEYSDFQ